MPKHEQKYTLICAKCGERFKSARDNARYCSDCRDYPVGNPYDTAKKRKDYITRTRGLRRCPFCGSNAELKRYDISKIPRFRFECTNENCIASVLPGRDFLSEKDARNAWNGRV